MYLLALFLLALTVLKLCSEKLQVHNALKHNISNYRNLPHIALGLFSLLVILVFSENVKGQSSVKKIEILGADDLIFDGEGPVKAKKLIGNVRVKHGDTYMECDSAYVYNATNTLKAYGHVKVYDQDSMEIRGDSMKYYGETKRAEIRGREVILIQDNIHLTTTKLDYDRQTGMGMYWDGGNVLMNDGKDSLFSYRGYYFNASSDMQFKDSVRLRTKDYKIESDTLHYNSRTEISKFFGPTTIVSDSDYIYTEKGWSDNKRQVSIFSKNSHIISDGQELIGDSIYYDQKNNIGRAWNNVSLIDTSNDFMVQGNYVYHNQKDSISLVLGEPMLTQFFDGDSLFLHADTLLSHYDSTGQYRLIEAWPKAQFFKSDLQGKSDSLVFSDIDSTITLYYNPIIWSEKNQITAQLITIYKNEDEIERMHMDYRAFIISEEDTSGEHAKYNQIKGDSMIGYFKESALHKVDVLHKGKSIYFAKQDDGKYIGMNKSQSEYMSIYLDSNEVKEIMFREKPDATLFPLKDVTPRMQYLKRFKWRGNEQPKKKEDIFIWKEEEEAEGE
jgi:lipopolysaccharide export system protein LptA